MLRPGFSFVPSATCPIAAGDVGEWLDSTTIPATPKRRLANGLDVVQPPVASGLVYQSGVIPSARMTGGTPVNGNVFAIGAGTYQFVTSLGAPTTYTQIKVLGSAALSLAAAVHAINGVADTNVVQGSTSTVAPVVADIVSTSLRIRLADARGGNPIAGVAASTAPTATVGGGGVWDAANLNVSGKSSGDSQVSIGQVAITAGMITAGYFNVELPFTPTVYQFDAYSAAGLLLAITDTVTIAGNSLLITLGGGGAPALVATNVISFMAIA